MHSSCDNTALALWLRRPAQLKGQRRGVLCTPGWTWTLPGLAAWVPWLRSTVGPAQSRRDRLPWGGGVMEAGEERGLA